MTAMIVYTKVFTIASQDWRVMRDLIQRPYTEEIELDYRVNDGGTLGTLAIRWYSLTAMSHEASAPRIEAFEDAWAILAEEAELVQGLAALPKPVTPLRVTLFLQRQGWRDVTRRQNPDNPRVRRLR